jgi:serine/threonine protein kinase
MLFRENNEEKLSEWSQEDNSNLHLSESKDNIIENTGQKVKYLYIQMEYFKEITLLSALKNNLLKDKNTKKKIISQLAYAISYIHENGMIHRAIKPKNIFLDKNMNLKLGGFGDPTLDDTSEDPKYCEISEKFTQKVKCL